MTLKITDVSSYQGKYKLGSYGEDGVIVKATQGTGYVNPYCDYVAQQAIKSGKPWGIYHYAGGGNANAEAEYFVKNTSGYLNVSNVPILVLDWESNQNAAWGNGAWASRFIARVKQLTGKQAGIYTGSDGVAQTGRYLANSAFLWFAGYPTSANVGWSPSKFPYSTGAWKILTGWQFSSNPLDKSIFYVDAKGWKALAGAKVTSVTPAAKPTATAKPKAKPFSTAGKNIEALAAEVAKGQAGNGSERQKKLGSLYQSVQIVLNYRARLLTRAQADQQLAKQVLAGNLGVGNTRKQRLGAFYNSVQAAVNRMV